MKKLYLTGIVVLSSLTTHGKELSSNWIEGTFKAGQMGSVSYSIPLELPPGVNGVAPEINIIYNGSSQRDALGVGFGVSGIKSISRCAASRDLDGYDDPVDFDENDQFCYGGNRLFRTRNYDSQGRLEFVPQEETFERVRATLSDDSLSPSDFTVLEKSGNKLYFGLTDVARIKHPHGTVTWLLSKVEDRYGNFIQYRYQKSGDHGETLLKEILYTGNELAGLTPQNRVVFEYRESVRAIEQYHQGIKSVLSSYLESIETFARDIPVFKYQMSYEGNDAVEDLRLSQIKKCTALGPCALPLTFEWRDKVSDVAFTDAESLQKLDNAYNWDRQKSHRGVVDINLDGYPDIYGIDQSGIKVSLGGPQGFALPIFALRKFQNPDRRVVDLGRDQIEVLDLNSDGYPDVLGFGSYGVYVSYGDGSTFTPPVEVTGDFSHNRGWKESGRGRAVVDINRDGHMDLIGYKTEGFFVAHGDGKQFGPMIKLSPLFSNSWDLSNNITLINDINGDGWLDLIGFSPTQTHIMLGKYDGFEPTVRLSFSLSRSGFRKDLHQLRLVDLNRDQLPDVVIFLDREVKVALNTGYFSKNKINGERVSPFTVPDIWSNYFGQLDGFRKNLPDQPIHVADFNLDGFPDILGFTNNQQLISYNTGTKFLPRENLGNDFTRDLSYDRRVDIVTPVDINGDGSLEFLGFHKNRVHISKNSIKRAKLKNITYGFNNQISFEYGYLQNQEIYSQNNLATLFPVVPYRGATEVLSAVTINDGVGGVKRVSYQYRDFLFHKSKFGGLGFQKRIITDHLTGIVTTETYSQNFESTQQGRLTKKLVEDSKGVAISQVEYEYRTIYFDIAKKRYQAVLDKSTTIKFDEYGRKLSEISHTIGKRDDYLNVLTQTAVTRGSGLEKIITTKSAFRNNDALWILGKIVSLDTTVQVNGRPKITRKSRWEYKLDLHLLKATTDPDTEFEQTVRTELNVMGLPKKITKSWPKKGNGLDFTSVSSFTEYDRFGMPSGFRNELGHSSSQEIEPAFGNRVWQKNSNGQTTSYEYDSFGDLRQKNHPDGTQTSILSGLCADEPFCPEEATSYVKNSLPGQAPTWEFFDRYNRSIMTRKVAFDGREVTSEVRYNKFGQKFRTSLPYFTGDSIFWSTLIFDDKFRLIKQIATDGSQSLIRHDGLTRVTTNSMGQESSVTRNILGEIVEAVDSKRQVLRYYYDSLSRYVEIEKPSGESVIRELNLLGQKIAMEEANSGLLSFSYNVLGMLNETVYPDGASISRRYDRLGRVIEKQVISKAGNEETFFYTYDSGSHGLGLISSESASDEKYQVRYEYDHLSRPTLSATIVDGELFDITTTYDQFSRPETTRFPTGFKVKNNFNTRGDLESIVSAKNPQKYYWKLLETNALGQRLKSRVGNGVISANEYFPDTGYLKQVKATSASNKMIQDQSYTFDSIGNLTNREDHLNSIYESFDYDDLNRLTDYLSGLNSVVIQYDEEGNIESRSDIGAYRYGGSCNGIRAGPNAVTSVTGTLSASYCYNSRGQLVRGDGRTITYTARGKPESIQKGSDSVYFYYGSGNTRYKRIDSKQGIETETIYIGGIYEKVSSAGKTKHRHYIGGIAIFTEEDGKVEEEYLHKDHLGSIVAISNEKGELTQSFRFDPWGKRIDNLSQQFTYLPEYQSSTHRGFTGHEHLDTIGGLVHMNGRVYDPEIGRFLSPDPMMSPGNLQGLNSYSYVLNNPLSYTDPDGMWGLKIGGSLGKAWNTNIKGVKSTIKDLSKGKIDKVVRNSFRTITTGNQRDLGQSYDKVGRWAKKNERTIITMTATVALTAAMGPAGLGLAGKSLLAAKMSIGFASGYYSSKGDLRTAVVSGLTAGAFHGVGASFGAAGDLTTTEAIGKTVAHGMVGGVRSVALGGNFEDGFTTGALTEGTSQLGLHSALGTSVPAQATMAAIVGGTVSGATGGSFEDGAILATFQYSMNHMTSEQKIALRAKSIAAGTAGGAIVGGASGAICTVGAVVCSPTGAYAGAAVGAMTGAVVAEAVIYGDGVLDAATEFFNEEAGAKNPTSPSKMQQEVKKDQAPRGVKRVDRPHVPGQEPHVHYDDGTSSTPSGRVHDAHRGKPNPNRKVRDWLSKHNWQTP